MNTMQCEACGYNMGGLDTLANTIEPMIFPGIGGAIPTALVITSNHGKNYVQCPNCGAVGKWLKQG